MKKNKQALLLTAILMTVNAVNAQNVRIGNTTSGVTASGNTLSIANGNGAIQLNNVPAMFQGAISAAKEMNNSENNTNTNNAGVATPQNIEANQSNISQENLAKIEAAKNNFIKQQEAVKIQSENIEKQNKEVIQEPVRVGQDLTTLKYNMVTNNIGLYNKSTITEIEEKSAKENAETYAKFPEYMIKNY